VALSILATIWWLFFLTAVGLCVGSFLNVVVYRVPRDQSIRDPLWSFCPGCGHRIRWHDNLPVLSFLLLKGRCRDCGVSISWRYPAIELLMAVVVIVLFDAFFVAQTRVGLFNEPYLTWALSRDWPILLAHLVLFACLLAMAVIDLQEYWVDIRFTTVATAVGFVLHALWTPDHSLSHAGFAGRTQPGWLRPSDPTALAAAGALLGLALVWVILRLRPPRPVAAESAEPEPEEHASVSLAADAELASGVAEPPIGTAATTVSPTTAGDAVPAMPPDGAGCPAQPESPEPGDPGVELPAEACPPVAERPMSSAWPAVGVLALGLVLAALLGCTGLVAEGVPGVPSHRWRSLVPAALVLVLVLGEARQPRSADQHIIEAIESERFSARRRTLGELLLLLPAIAGGVAALWVYFGHEPARDWVAAALGWRVGQEWQPLRGLATAAAGYVIGGGIGWAVRIVFTLAFGKEAFGLGDIHMMAATGCVAGWPVVLLGFVLTVFIAMGAWLITLPVKRTRAIPLVPWLALGYLIVVVHYENLLRFPPVRNALELVHMLVLQKSQT